MLKGKRATGHREQGMERCNWKEGRFLIPALPQLYSQPLQHSLELG